MQNEPVRAAEIFDWEVLRTLGCYGAEASDMSGWLLMGLPGLAYWCGLVSFLDSSWIVLGTYLNWLLVAKRLRIYSHVGDAITIPDFLSNRFKEEKKTIMTIAALFILVFFVIYAPAVLWESVNYSA